MTPEGRLALLKVLRDQASVSRELEDKINRHVQANRAFDKRYQEALKPWHDEREERHRSYQNLLDEYQEAQAKYTKAIIRVIDATLMDGT